ncbi:hypothetical protein SR858_00380 [Duganella zoogloeoides]|uniref:Uncharacterized protein n=1 Tax=Duganella zoogloeoides TaxID=75659 RepID=A0ABZ0XZE9_9BURK|nr:hypothetical protein [Duganella zoogloeoides]WQH04833.1 hypothetical protein SR858_00380 [Duganella zoogloeoides]
MTSIVTPGLFRMAVSRLDEHGASTSSTADIFLEATQLQRRNRSKNGQQ